MTKYTIMTELVKAGCNLDRLPAEILEAIENACLNPTPAVQQASPSVKGELLKQLSILEDSRVVGAYARTVKDYIMEGDITRATREFGYIGGFSSFQSDNVCYNAYLKANELIGQLI